MKIFPIIAVKPLQIRLVIYRFSMYLPAVSDHLSSERGITFVSINDLVVHGIEDLPGIFTPTKRSDLKRIK